MSKESIEQLIKIEAERIAKELVASTASVVPEDQGSIYQVGAKLFIRTVTHFLVGQVCHVSSDEIGLVKAAWVADTGRFHQFLLTGKPSEVEPAPTRCSVGRGAIIDAYIWPHALLTEQK